VHAWEAWGEACVQRLRGMFAFALWDRNQQTLFLARDRLGVKPMHYALLDDGTLLFGSELKSLLAYTGGAPLRRDIDPRRWRSTSRSATSPSRAPSSARRTSCRRPHADDPPRPAGAAPQPYWDLRFTLDSPIGAEDACDELRARLASRCACA
jgi:asparagine synthase (glutamine-hydrolysing)